MRKRLRDRRRERMGIVSGKSAGLGLRESPRKRLGERRGRKRVGREGLCRKRVGTNLGEGWLLERKKVLVLVLLLLLLGEKMGEGISREGV